MIEFLWLFALVVFAFVAIYAISSFTESRRLTRVEEHFYLGREPLSDDAYLTQVHACHAPEFHFGARRAMATLCGTTPDMIYPTDRMRELLDLQLDRGFIEDFLLFTEKETGQSLDLRSIPDPEACNFTEYVERLMEVNSLTPA